MKQALELLLILGVVLTAWTCQWITYRIGCSHGRKMAERESAGNNKGTGTFDDNKSATKKIDKLQ